MLIDVYANQPLSKSYILYKGIGSYVKATSLLQSFCILCVLLCYLNFLALDEAIGPVFFFHLFFSIYFFSLIITTQLDAYSRHQNYKMAKDLLYQYGFKKPLIRVFSKSKCQREAVTEAGNSLGFKKEIDDYFYSMGFRWYHILPVVIVRKPRTLFTKEYWFSTFFVSNYKSKYFYW